MMGQEKPKARGCHAAVVDDTARAVPMGHRRVYIVRLLEDVDQAGTAANLLF